MAGGVTSGLGRTGPWLQNDHLRIETRLEDGSLSPFAVATGFRPAERVLAYVSVVDGPPVSFGRCEYDVRPHEDRIGSGRVIELRSRDRRGLILRREVALYDGQPFAVTRVGITNEGSAPLRLGMLHAFTTPEGGRGRLRLDAAPGVMRIYRHGWQSWSPTMSLAGNAMDLRSPPTVLGPEPPATEPGRFACDDVGVLHDPAAGRALLAGAVSARDFLSQVYVDVPARHVDARSLADGLALKSGDTAWSERFAIDICGTPQEQLERYGAALAAEMQARVPQQTPSGWCSWYYFYQQVTEDDVIRNLRALERLRRELPIDTVQIDDGYQADIGDWLTVNEKFPHGMEWLAAQIREAGYTPGIWLAPFLLAESSKTFAAHAEWVVRDGAGRPVSAMHNWNRHNYGIDGSHPEARAWLTDLFRQVCEGWGYDYVKIDFLFAAAIAGQRHDPGATRARAYRQALQAVRDGVGDQRFILGCGSLMAASVGLFDGNRIGLDTAPFWRFLSREEREAPRLRPRRPDDILSAETSTRNVLNRWWMHRRLWANDPDCLMVRDTRTKLTAAEIESAAAVIGLSGGMTLISDDLPLLSADRIAFAARFVPPLPESAAPPDLTASDMPARFDYEDARAFDPVRIAGAFNWADDTAPLRIELPSGPWHAFDIWAGEYLGEREGSLDFDAVPPHGCRVIALRRALDRPQLIGTDAHIGAGVLDVTGVAWDDVRRTLALTVAPAGRPERAVWVAAAGRRPIAARFAGRPVAPGDGGRGSVRFAVRVEAEAVLEVEFSPLGG